MPQGFRNCWFCILVFLFSKFTTENELISLPQSQWSIEQSGIKAAIDCEMNIVYNDLSHPLLPAVGHKIDISEIFQSC